MGDQHIVDEQARDQIASLRMELQKVTHYCEKAILEIRAIVVGADGTNGLKSRIVTLEKSVRIITDNMEELKKALQHYIDVERKKSCHGLEELKRRDEAAQVEEEEETEVQVAEIHAEATLKAADRAARAAERSQWIVLFGVILSAIFVFLKK